MSEFTTRYGLAKLSAGDKLSDNDYQFTTRDRDNMDSKLWLGAEGHVHDGASAAVVNPSDPLGYSLVTTAGFIPASRTVRYKFSWVDSNGGETAASPELVVTTPAAVATPGSPTLLMETTGGTLLAGNYFYIMTAWETVNTQETLGSQPVYTSVPYNVSTGKVTLTLPSLPLNADGFNIYKREPGSTEYHFLTSIDMTVATPPSTYVDDGSDSVNCNRGLPISNTTFNANSVVLSLPGATPTVPQGLTWKIYRTYTSGDWDNSLLAWVVEETSEGSGIITPTYTDTGGPTLQGSPSNYSSIVGSPSKIDLSSHVQNVLAVEHLPTPFAQQYLNQSFIVTFVEPGSAEVENSVQIWVNEFTETKILGCRAYLGRDSYPLVNDVIVDVNRYSGATPTWTTIYTTQANRPKVPAGQMIGSRTIPDVTTLYDGDALTIDVDQVGGGTTPTDKQVTVNILIQVVKE